MSNAICHTRQIDSWIIVRWLVLYITYTSMSSQGIQIAQHASLHRFPMYKMGCGMVNLKSRSFCTCMTSEMAMFDQQNFNFVPSPWKFAVSLKIKCLLWVTHPIWPSIRSQPLNSRVKIKSPKLQNFKSHCCDLHWNRHQKTLVWVTNPWDYFSFLFFLFGAHWHGQE